MFQKLDLRYKQSHILDLYDPLKINLLLSKGQFIVKEAQNADNYGLIYLLMLELLIYKYDNRMTRDEFFTKNKDNPDFMKSVTANKEQDALNNSFTYSPFDYSKDFDVTYNFFIRFYVHLMKSRGKQLLLKEEEIKKLGSKDADEINLKSEEVDIQNRAIIIECFQLLNSRAKLVDLQSLKGKPRPHEIVYEVDSNVARVFSSDMPSSEGFGKDFKKYLLIYGNSTSVDPMAFYYLMTAKRIQHGRSCYNNLIEDAEVEANIQSVTNDDQNKGGDNDDDDEKKYDKDDHGKKSDNEDDGSKSDDNKPGNESGSENES